MATRAPRCTRIASAGARVRWATDQPLSVALHGPLIAPETCAGATTAVSPAAAITASPAALRSALMRPPRRLTTLRAARRFRFCPSRAFCSEELVFAAEDRRHGVVGEDVHDRLGEQPRHGQH